jgi:tetratricopeptide (TPR) repeat protein
MDLAGAAVGVVGRFDRVPRTRLSNEIERRGGKITRRLALASGLVIGHGAYLRLDDGPLPETLRLARERGCWCLSEHGFLRRLGLLQPAAPVHRTLSLGELARRSSCAEETLALLALFDIIEDHDSRFEFRDLVIARNVQRLLDAGVLLSRIIAAALVVQRRAAEPRILACGRLVRLSDDDLAFQLGQNFADGSGQLHLPLDRGGHLTAAQLFALAEEAEDEERWADAESLYRRVLAVDPRDAVSTFNLSNTVREQGRLGEAERLLRKAVTLDPGFAEAWYNLAHLAESDGGRAAAQSYLQRAIAIDGSYADAIYNLARLRLLDGAPAAAAALYERYLALDRSSRYAERARRALSLCRLMAGGEDRALE